MSQVTAITLHSTSGATVFFDNGTPQRIEAGSIVDLRTASGLFGAAAQWLKDNPVKVNLAVAALSGTVSPKVAALVTALVSALLA